jgi:hypothetical protein
MFRSLALCALAAAAAAHEDIAMTQSNWKHSVLDSKNVLVIRYYNSERCERGYFIT